MISRNHEVNKNVAERSRQRGESTSPTANTFSKGSLGGANEALAEAIKEISTAALNRALIVIPGAGVSAMISGGNPISLWQGFLQYAIIFCRQSALSKPSSWFNSLDLRLRSGSVDDLLAVFSAVREALVPGEFERLMAQTLGSLSPKHPQIAKALSALGPIMTPNLDYLIELSTNMRTVTLRQPRHFQRVLAGLEIGCCHIHGVAGDPKSIVMDSSGYVQLLGTEAATTLLGAMPVFKTLLVVGFGDGTSDPTFTFLFRSIQQHMNALGCQIYRLVRECDVETARTAHVDQRVFVVPYGKEYADLVPFLERLAPAHVSLPSSTRRRIIKIAASLGAAAAIGSALYRPGSHRPSSLVRIEGIIWTGADKVAPRAVLRLGDTPLAVTDDHGSFDFELKDGLELQRLFVDYGQLEAIEFTFPAAIRESSFVELRLNEGKGMVRPLK